MLEVSTIVNVYGKGVNFDHCKITKETEKAFMFETVDSFGSHLRDYNVTFWLPKKICFENVEDNGAFGITITLPGWFTLSTKKDII